MPTPGRCRRGPWERPHLDVNSGLQSLFLHSCDFWLGHQECHQCKTYQLRSCCISCFAVEVVNKILLFTWNVWVLSFSVLEGTGDGEGLEVDWPQNAQNTLWYQPGTDSGHLISSFSKPGTQHPLDTRSCARRLVLLSSLPPTGTSGLSSYLPHKRELPTLHLHYPGLCLLRFLPGSRQAVRGAPSAYKGEGQLGSRHYCPLSLFSGFP